MTPSSTRAPACLTDPKGCSLNKIKLPEIELTLTKLGTFRTPSDPSKVMNFFKDQVFVALKRAEMATTCA